MEILAPYLKGRIPSADESVFAAGLTSLGAAELSMDLRESGYDISYQDLYRGLTPSGILNISAQKDRCTGLTIFGRERNPEEIFLCFSYAGGGAECFERFAAGFQEKPVQVWVIDPALVFRRRDRRQTETHPEPDQTDTGCDESSCHG